MWSSLSNEMMSSMHVSFLTTFYWLGGQRYDHISSPPGGLNNFFGAWGWGGIYNHFGNGMG